MRQGHQPLPLNESVRKSRESGCHFIIKNDTFAGIKWTLITVDAGAKSGKQTKLHPQLTELPMAMVIKHSMTELITKVKYNVFHDTCFTFLPSKMTDIMYGSNKII
jgi:hypothetical protein